MRFFYRCSECGRTEEPRPGIYLCPLCSSRQEKERPLSGVLEVAWEGEFEGEGIPLPIEPRYFPPIPVGDTPFWFAERLGKELGFGRLFLKDETSNPTGSLKDRASFLVAAFARKFGVREICLASTGNAASSMAGVGAAAGLDVTVFLPVSAPQAKRIQVLQYGARLVSVEGNYDQAYELSLEYSKANGCLSRNTAYNPLTIEGKKTVSYEIAAELGRFYSFSSKTGGKPPQSGRSGLRFEAIRDYAREWHKFPAARRHPYLAPGHVFVPTGDGVILAGVYRGFEDLLALGRIKMMPKIWAVQAEGSSAIARALELGSFGSPLPSATIADSIAVDVPRNGIHALGKLRKHGGRTVTVSDGEILSAQRMLASRTGLFAEPSSSAALAGFLKAKGEIGADETVVLLITGSGLKDIKSAARGLGLEG